MHMIDHKKWLASFVPPAKYNNQNMKVVKPRIMSATVRGKPTDESSARRPVARHYIHCCNNADNPPTAKEGARPGDMSKTWKIPKMNDPGPGAY